VITNIGLAHVGRLGSYEAVRNAKLEILRSVDVIIANGDDRGLMEGITHTRDFKGRVITFGIERDVDVRGLSPVHVESGMEFVLMIEDNKTRVSLMIHGMFNVYNALAAAAVGYSLGLTMEEIKKGLESYRGFSMRFEIIETERGITLINDAYNANPSSMKQAIKELLSIKRGQRKIAVLGDMYELGEYSHSAHREVLEYALTCGLDIVVAVGREMISASKECNAQDTILITSQSPEDALSELQGVIKEGDVILVKGSRAMKMETVVEGLRDVI
jgi:UDP-N-acetylmuramoyl-tripeptide--D-alanyl-D-alanine ligase